MLSSITVGANGLPRSGRFYSAIPTPLGYEKKDAGNGYAFSLPNVSDSFNSPGAVYVTRPYDGREATVGNGSMIAFRAPTHDLVHIIHAAGLDAGGSNEGTPGFRVEYSDWFDVGYLRDPLGNKIAIFCSNPAEGKPGISSRSRAALIPASLVGRRQDVEDGGSGGTARTRGRRGSGGPFGIDQYWQCPDGVLFRRHLSSTRQLGRARAVICRDGLQHLRRGKRLRPQVQLATAWRLFLVGT